MPTAKIVKKIELTEEQLVARHIDKIKAEQAAIFETYAEKTRITKAANEVLGVSQVQAQDELALTKVQIDELIHQISSKNSELTVLGTQVDELKKQKSACSTEIEEHETIARTLLEKNEVLKGIFEELQQQKKALETTLAQEQVALAGIQQQNKSAEVLYQVIVKKNKELTADALEIEEKVTASNSMLAQLTVMQAQLEEDNKILELTKKTLLADIETLKNTSSMIDVENKRKKDEGLHALTAKIAETDAHNLFLIEETKKLKGLRSITEEKYKKFDIFKDRIDKILMTLLVKYPSKEIESVLNQLKQL